MTKDTHKGNGIEPLAGGKYQTNIVEFPLVIQMERILREATRIEILFPIGCESPLPPPNPPPTTYRPRSQEKKA